MSTKRRARRQSFGRTRKERSGRWSAAYQHDGELHRPGVTFPAKMAAVAWLAAERRLIDLGTWTPPAQRVQRAAAARSGTTVAQYASTWLRDKPVARRTRESYAYLLGSRLFGTELAAQPITTVTPADVRAWFGSLDAATPSARARAYATVSAVFASAVADGLLPANPAQVRNATKVRRSRAITHLGATEVTALADAMPEHLRAAVLLGAWAGLRFGEVLALDRSDLAADGSMVFVTKGLVRRNGLVTIGPPKTPTSVRTVMTPPNIRADLIAHLGLHVGPEPTAPLFTAAGERLTEGRFRAAWDPARSAIGRPALRFHDLRHFCGVSYARVGATVAESMGRLGHASPRTALLYQSLASGRDSLLASQLAALAIETEQA